MTTRALPFSTTTLAKAAAIFSGLTFGIYWIPLRAMSDAGINGLWSVALFNLVSLVMVLPVAILRWRDFIPGAWRLHLGTFTAGLTFVLYAGAFLYTEVIRVIVLFYLMPIWGFLLARFVLGEKITGIHGLSMALGLGGLIVICGVEQGIPMPSNTGDWMAFIAGFTWACVALSLLIDHQDPINYSIGFLFWASACSVVLALFGTQNGVLAKPDLSQLASILPWLIPFTLLIVIPAVFATIYGPTHLNPGVVGLLFMTEIGVAAATAALFAGEPFGRPEITGVILIMLAGIAEPLFQRIRSNKPVKQFVKKASDD